MKRFVRCRRPSHLAPEVPEDVHPHAPSSVLLWHFVPSLARGLSPPLCALPPRLLVADKVSLVPLHSRFVLLGPQSQLVLDGPCLGGLWRQSLTEASRGLLPPLPLPGLSLPGCSWTAPWPVLRDPGRPLKSLWAALGPLLARRAPPLGCSRPLWGRPGGFLGLLWGVLGGSWPPKAIFTKPCKNLCFCMVFAWFRAFWAPLGGSWVALGPS